ncbi:M48 family metallopeptidase [[Limnothrix rosea] IAM M-220]|uniref:M48 family metallopeptidase n=1 Tax=[Limnothrix rosea] IAM M-220 TaxID=454133 RepID=UPI0009690D5B|nr:M48 family metallopeptidase [[Limnothrix rosea] IAM M-220]OKH17078.1 peptidase M48 [[Limnothrix rosea] IAM M-220]
MSESQDPLSDQPWSDRNKPPETKELITLGGMFLCLIILLIWLLNFAVNWLIVQMPVSWEQQLGQAIVKAYEPQSLDSPQQDKLNELVNDLEAHISPDSKAYRDYQVLYIPTEVVNAGAIPGDTILVYQGLLDQMGSENELMMVLGHEIGHFANRDHLRSIGKALVIRTVISSIFGDVTFIADAAQIISSTRFSQAQEKEADQYGLDLLYKNYDQVAGATDFFARLSENAGANWDFLASHPAPAKRVTALEQLIAAKDYPIGEYTPLPEMLKES